MRRQKLFKQKLMKILNRNQKKMMNYLFCPNASFNSRRKDKANPEDKEGQVVVLSLRQDSRKLELAKNSHDFSARRQAISRMNVPG